MHNFYGYVKPKAIRLSIYFLKVLPITILILKKLFTRYLIHRCEQACLLMTQTVSNKCNKTWYNRFSLCTCRLVLRLNYHIFCQFSHLLSPVCLACLHCSISHVFNKLVKLLPFPWQCSSTASQTSHPTHHPLPRRPSVNTSNSYVLSVLAVF